LFNRLTCQSSRKGSTCSPISTARYVFPPSFAYNSLPISRLTSETVCPTYGRTGSFRVDSSCSYQRVIPRCSSWLRCTKAEGARLQNVTIFLAWRYGPLVFLSFPSNVSRHYLAAGLNWSARYLAVFVRFPPE
jgi:hypothetical protein